MDLTSISDQALKDLITGKSQVELDFLAAKIMLTKLRSRARVDPSPTALAESAPPDRMDIGMRRRGYRKGGPRGRLGRQEAVT